MRDPNRIDKFCNSLANIWNKVPDWRFGQLIYNLILTQFTSTKMFYLEDDEMMKAIREKIEELKNDQSW